jgi:hypothetical protein
MMAIKLGNLVAVNFLHALRELVSDISSDADAAVASRQQRKHPWDSLGR